jgi:hypothetical protein
MFCTNCGATIEQNARYCAGCGTPAQRGDFPSSPTAASSKIPTRSRALGCGVAVFALLAVMGVCTYSLKEPGQTSSPASQSTPQPSEARHKCGDDVLVGYWAYRCINASWHGAIGSQYSRQHPDAEFLVVDIAIRNNDKTASALPPMKLVDNQGREYDESSKGIFIDGSFGMLKNVNPGVSSRGYVVFDVPHGNYALEVSGGFTSGKSVLIDLP